MTCFARVCLCAPVCLGVRLSVLFFYVCVSVCSHSHTNKHTHTLSQSVGNEAANFEWRSRGGRLNAPCSPHLHLLKRKIHLISHLREKVPQCTLWILHSVKECMCVCVRACVCVCVCDTRSQKYTHSLEETRRRQRHTAPPQPPPFCKTALSQSLARAQQCETQSQPLHQHHHSLYSRPHHQHHLQHPCTGH